MASSGSVETTSYKNKALTLSWSLESQSSENNTSTISWKLVGSGSQSEEYYITCGAFKVVIDGKTVLSKDTSYRVDVHKGDVLFTGTHTITHNSDGTKSFSISVEAAIYYSTVNCSGSSNFTLDTIPRASSISSASNITIGNACSVQWTPMAKTFYYKLKFSLGSWSATTSAVNPNTTSAYAYTNYTIPNEVANQLPNATSGTMTVTLYTYANSACSTMIGSASSKTFTVSLPSSMKPTINSVTATIDNSGNSVVSAWGIAVAGYTKVKVVASASGSYSSTISSFTISGGYSTTKNGTSLSYTGGAISSSGSKTFSVSCKDSRGRTSSAVTSSAITFYAYSKPSISSFSVVRNSNNANKVTVNANWSFASVNGKNSATATLYYKKSSSSQWSTYGTIERNKNVVLTTTFEDVSSYNFKVIVTDALSQSAQDEGFISTLEVLLDFRSGGKGLGIGKICESDSMEVSLDAKFFGTVYINGVTLEEYIRSIVG